MGLALHLQVFPHSAHWAEKIISKKKITFIDYNGESLYIVAAHAVSCTPIKHLFKKKSFAAGSFDMEDERSWLTLAKYWSVPDKPADIQRV